MKKICFVFAMLLCFVTTFGSLPSEAMSISLFRESIIETYSDYIAIMEAGELTEDLSGDESSESKRIIKLPEDGMLFDEITLLGVFDSFHISILSTEAAGCPQDTVAYYRITYLAPGYRTTLRISFYSAFDGDMGSEIPSRYVGEDLWDVSFNTSGFFPIGKLYYEYSYPTNYDQTPVYPDAKLSSINWFSDDRLFMLSFEETTDTSPLFDELTEEQLGEMEAFREGLFSKETCVSTMEAVNYRPGLLGTGMTIEKDGSSAPAESREETSAAETASVPAVSDVSVPEEPAKRTWVFAVCGIGVLAVAVTAIVLLCRKKK